MFCSCFVCCVGNANIINKSQTAHIRIRMTSLNNYLSHKYHSNFVPCTIKYISNKSIRCNLTMLSLNVYEIYFFYIGINFLHCIITNVHCRAYIYVYLYRKYISIHQKINLSYIQYLWPVFTDHYNDTCKTVNWRRGPNVT